MKSSDTIIIGAGIIGLALAIELRKKGLRVLIVERGEPGREASYAAAGMLAASGDEFPRLLKPMAQESARMYPEFVHQLEDESGLKVDLRHQGTILILCDGAFPETAELLSPQRLKSLEPEVALATVLPAGRTGGKRVRTSVLPTFPNARLIPTRSSRPHTRLPAIATLTSPQTPR
jgi:glycine/D-amino acid oxidase-like deaminating enzyme